LACLLGSALLPLGLVFTFAAGRAESSSSYPNPANVRPIITYDRFSGIAAQEGTAVIARPWEQRTNQLTVTAVPQDHPQPHAASSSLIPGAALDSRNFNRVPKFRSARRNGRPFLAAAWQAENGAGLWQMIYGVAVLGLVLSAVQKRGRSPLLKRMQALSASTTRIARRTLKATHRLRYRDELGELAAALDGLAESLSEKNSEPPKNKQAFQDPAEWLPTLSRFNRALRTCADLPSIQHLLVETVEGVFPGCAIALCLNNKSGRFKLMECRNLAPDLKWLISEAELETSQIATGRSDSAMLPESPNGFYRPDAESLSQHGWISHVNIPLVARGEAVATLSLYGRERRELSRLELDFLTTLADQAALAIDKFRFYEQTVAQAVQLRQANDALAKSNVAKSDFVSIMSHEFRTPLNLIMGYTEMMQEELMGKISAEQDKCLKRIMKASDDLLALVMNMLQVGNIEAGCLRVNKEEVGLSSLLGELQSDLALPEKKNVVFLWDIPAQLPIIRTDGEKLKHVVRHLIDNAVKFTERGQVMVSSRNVLRAGKVEITISDTGVGIPNEILPVVFEKYRQLDHSIARTYDGMGLGLFIAKKITEMLGGELKVTSERGKGSTFTVALPLGG
jgi:signal transduction histidine kinase